MGNYQSSLLTAPEPYFYDNILTADRLDALAQREKQLTTAQRRKRYLVGKKYIPALSIRPFDLENVPAKLSLRNLFHHEYILDAKLHSLRHLEHVYKHRVITKLRQLIYAKLVDKAKADQNNPTHTIPFAIQQRYDALDDDVLFASYRLSGYKYDVAAGYLIREMYDTVLLQSLKCDMEEYLDTTLSKQHDKITIPYPSYRLVNRVLFADSPYEPILVWRNMVQLIISLYHHTNGTVTLPLLKAYHLLRLNGWKVSTSIQFYLRDLNGYDVLAPSLILQFHSVFPKDLAVKYAHDCLKRTDFVLTDAYAMYQREITRRDRAAVTLRKALQGKGYNVTCSDRALIIFLEQSHWDVNIACELYTTNAVRLIDRQDEIYAQQIEKLKKHYQLPDDLSSVFTTLASSSASSAPGSTNTSIPQIPAAAAAGNNNNNSRGDNTNDNTSSDFPISLGYGRRLAYNILLEQQQQQQQQQSRQQIQNASIMASTGQQQQHQQQQQHLSNTSIISASEGIIHDMTSSSSHTSHASLPIPSVTSSFHVPSHKKDQQLSSSSSSSSSLGSLIDITTITANTTTIANTILFPSSPLEFIQSIPPANNLHDNIALFITAVLGNTQEDDDKEICFTKLFNLHQPLRFPRDLSAVYTHPYYHRMDWVIKYYEQMIHAQVQKDMGSLGLSSSSSSSSSSSGQSPDTTSSSSQQQQQQQPDEQYEQQHRYKKHQLRLYTPHQLLLLLETIPDDITSYQDITQVMTRHPQYISPFIGSDQHKHQHSSGVPSPNTITHTISTTLSSSTDDAITTITTSKRSGHNPNVPPLNDDDIVDYYSLGQMANYLNSTLVNTYHAFIKQRLSGNGEVTAVTTTTTTTTPNPTITHTTEVVDKDDVTSRQDQTDQDPEQQQSQQQQQQHSKKKGKTVNDKHKEQPKDNNSSSDGDSSNKTVITATANHLSINAPNAAETASDTVIDTTDMTEDDVSQNLGSFFMTQLELLKIQQFHRLYEDWVDRNTVVTSKDVPLLPSMGNTRADTTPITPSFQQHKEQQKEQQGHEQEQETQQQQQQPEDTTITSSTTKPNRKDRQKVKQALSSVANISHSSSNPPPTSPLSFLPKHRQSSSRMLQSLLDGDDAISGYTNNNPNNNNSGNNNTIHEIIPFEASTEITKIFCLTSAPLTSVEVDAAVVWIHQDRTYTPDWLAVTNGSGDYYRQEINSRLIALNNNPAIGTVIVTQGHQGCPRFYIHVVTPVQYTNDHDVIMCIRNALNAIKQFDTPLRTVMIPPIHTAIEYSPVFSSMHLLASLSRQWLDIVANRRVLDKFIINTPDKTWYTIALRVCCFYYPPPRYDSHTMSEYFQYCYNKGYDAKHYQYIQQLMIYDDDTAQTFRQWYYALLCEMNDFVHELK